MQDGHQIDHRVAAADQLLQGDGIVHVGRHQLDGGQRAQVLRALRSAAGHQDAPASTVGSLDQLFAHAAANEAAAAQHQDACG
jgi:hypothetical protein